MLRFTASHETWLAGEMFDAGDHEIEDPSAELVKHAGSAHAAGVLTVTEGLDVSHVQSQEAGEAALREAMGEHHVVQNPDGTRDSYWDGPWFEAHQEEAARDEEARRTGVGGTVIDITAADVADIGEVLG